MNNSPSKYFAFISYNQKDTKWGKRLQHKLEAYKMPATLLVYEMIDYKSI